MAIKRIFVLTGARISLAAMSLKDSANPYLTCCFVVKVAVTMPTRASTGTPGHPLRGDDHIREYDVARSSLQFRPNKTTFKHLHKFKIGRLPPKRKRIDLPSMPVLKEDTWTVNTKRTVFEGKRLKEPSGFKNQGLKMNKEL